MLSLEVPESVEEEEEEEDSISKLTSTVLDLYLGHPPSRRLLISISGIPGSGKTSFANAIVRRLNTVAQVKYGVAIACSVPMDGFHFSRKSLDAFPNTEEAHRRRGAPFTFDAEGVLGLLDKLKEPVHSKNSPIVYAPSFDHAAKDPVLADIPVLPSQRIILFEGNYLCFEPPEKPMSDFSYPSSLWGKIAALFDERWVIETPLEVTSSRLAARHLDAGIVKTLAEGFDRANGSDRQNANDIIQWRGKVDRRITSFRLE